MSRYIDADALLKYKAQLYDENGVGVYAVGTGNILRMPTADVVSREKYDELNERYHRLLESAKILSDAVKEYERREDAEIY